MGVTDPYPSHPIIGDALDPAIVLAKFNALFQGVQAFDGSQIVAGSVQSAAFATSINPITRTNESSAAFVASGITWSIVSGLNATMSSGVIYIQGIRVPVSSIGTQAFVASKDTYVDIDFNGNVTLNPVANGAAAPTLTANSIRVAKLVSGASLTSVSQFGADSLGNIIYPVGSVSAAGIQNPYKFSVYSNTNVAIAAATQKIAYNTKNFDTGNNFDATTNYRYTIPVSGYWWITIQAGIGSAGMGTTESGKLVLYKNGSPIKESEQKAGSGTATFLPRPSITTLLPLVAGDYLEGFAVMGGVYRDIVGANTITFFEGFLGSRS